VDFGEVDAGGGIVEEIVAVRGLHGGL
jgi:hypothetical protein